MAYFRSVGGSGTGATITVAYSSEFYGETITCSHGTKIYSKTAPSTGTVDFTVYEEGTWTISCTIGADTYSTTAEIDLTASAVLDAIPNGETVLPTDDVETWLACAGITDEAYTTISQVLGDSETYNALLGDSNACAYMKRSTTWSTDICASQYAMNLLGQYDTACDALLSDATWASAIAQSAYFESVVTPLVPKMTSNTAPSGEVFGSNIASATPKYTAFDRDTSTIVNNDSGIQIELGYKFDSAIKVYFASVTNRTNATPYAIKDFTIKGSADGTTYTDLGSGTATNTSGATTRVVLSDNTNCLYFKMANTTAYDSSYVRVAEVQFYGRTPSSEKIHGGNPTYDSFYRIVDGNNVPVTDPSLLDAGTYTIYSNGLAKDPDNLSNDYGKTVRICPNTKEIVVRPDNSLYWWGYKSVDIEGCTTANGWALSTIYFSSPTLVSPTWNATSINISTVNNPQQICGVGTKNKISLNKIRAIITPLHAHINGTPTYIFNQWESKKIGNTGMKETKPFDPTLNVMNVSEFTPAASGDYYYDLEGYLYMQLDIHAVLYE